MDQEGFPVTSGLHLDQVVALYGRRILMSRPGRRRKAASQGAEEYRACFAVTTSLARKSQDISGREHWFPPSAAVPRELGYTLGQGYRLGAAFWTDEAGHPVHHEGRHQTEHPRGAGDGHRHAGRARPQVLSWEDRDRLADIEENLAAEDAKFADRMRTSRSARRVPPPVATMIAVGVAALILLFLPPVPMIITVLLIIAAVGGTYWWLRRSTGRP